MYELIEQYKRKIETINIMIDNTNPNDTIKMVRLTTKESCYRTFLNEIVKAQQENNGQHKNSL